jgi:P27 family predicted phage terminase small subunit
MKPSNDVDHVPRARSLSKRAKKSAVEPLAPDCPPELGPVARAEWHRLVPELARLNLITHLDRAPLAIYCVAYAQWVDAAEFIQKFGSMVKTPSGFPVQSPYVAILNRQADTMIRIASEFGFTPASRAKLIPEKAKNYWPDQFGNLNEF